MQLHLTNGYPYPFPPNLTDAENDNISNSLATLILDGVKSFEWKHTVTIEFSTYGAMQAAMAATGWQRWAEVNNTLEAPTSADDGYDHPAIIAGDKAYCGIFLSSEA